MRKTTIFDPLIIHGYILLKQFKYKVGILQFEENIFRKAFNIITKHDPKECKYCDKKREQVLFFV